MTQEKVGEAIGKDRSTVANGIRLLALPEDVLGLVQIGTMPARAAMEFLPFNTGKGGLQLIEAVMSHLNRWAFGDYSSKAVSSAIAERGPLLGVAATRIRVRRPLVWEAELRCESVRART